MLLFNSSRQELVRKSALAFAHRPALGKDLSVIGVEGLALSPKANPRWHFIVGMYLGRDFL